MRLICTSHVTEGTFLGADIQVGNPQGVPLLRRGVRLTLRLRDRLLAAGIHAIYVEDDLFSDIELIQLVDDETRAFASRAVAGAFANARRGLERGEPLGEASHHALQDVVGRILDRLEDCGATTSLALADLASADAYTFQHSIDVTAVGLLIARSYWSAQGWLDHTGQRRFDGLESRLAELGMGLLLHDVGKLAIPLTVLHKPARLDPSEWELMKRHPRMGVDLLEADHWSPLVKSVVLRHHERWNGSGYPGGRVREDIHEMARIAGVADTFDAIVSERPYAAARPASTGVDVVREGAGTLFDPDVVAAFCQVVPPHPPGTEVTMPDGRHAVVVSVEPGRFDAPRVRTFDGEELVVELAVVA